MNPTSFVADAHDAGPDAFWFRRAVQLMLMMLPAAFWFRRALQLMVMMLARLRFGSKELRR